MRKYFIKNPLVYLATRLWRHSKGYHRWVICYGVMATIAILLSLISPLIIRELANSVQKLNAEELSSKSIELLSLYVIIGIIFWFFHGPSRVIEQLISFTTRRIFQTEMYKDKCVVSAVHKLNLLRR